MTPDPLLSLPGPFLMALPRLLEVSQVAHRLSSSPEYVRILLREKKLAGVRLGQRWRVDARVLEAYIDARRTIADAP